MKLEEIVCSLEYAKRLKELGFEKENSYFKFRCYDKSEGIENGYHEAVRNNYKVIGKNEYSAYTASELLEFLPKNVELHSLDAFNNYRFNLTRSCVLDDETKIIDTYIINYHCDTSYIGDLSPRLLCKNIWDKNLCNALAKMLIYLIENKLIEV